MVDDGSSVEYVFPPHGEQTLPQCGHGDVERLGFDAGQNEYSRCRDCGAVIVGFTASKDWEERREALSVEPRDWNPLLDALRSNQYASERQERRDGGQESGSLTDRARATWRRLFRR